MNSLPCGENAILEETYSYVPCRDSWPAIGEWGERSKPLRLKITTWPSLLASLCHNVWDADAQAEKH